MLNLSSQKSSLKHGRVVMCHAKASKQQTTQIPQSIPQKIVSAGMASLLTISSALPAFANEYDLFAAPAPITTGYVDDTESLWTSTKKTLNEKTQEIETKDGITLRIVMTRRLDIENDPEAVGQKLLDQWYPEDQENKGVLVLVTSTQEGALVGGETFMNKVGGDLSDSVLADTIPYWLKGEKNNRAVLASLERLQAGIEGTEDPGPPFVKEAAPAKAKPRTPEQLAKYKRISWTVVGTLLFIAVAVPMIQFYGYTAKN